MILVYKNCVSEVQKEKDKKVEGIVSGEYKYILSQRKAYVNWINKDFYEKN